MMESRIMPSPGMICWGNIFSFLFSGSIDRPFLRLHPGRLWFKDFMKAQIAPIELDCKLSVEVLSELHFPSPHSNRRVINQKSLAFPSHYITVVYGPYIFETENLAQIHSIW